MTYQRQVLMNIARWIVPLAIAVLSGCATEFDLSKGIPWQVGKDGKFETPMQVVAFWNDAVQNQTDKPRGIRGFAGRMYFYGKDPNKPVKVKGTLVVYAFDETNRDPKNVIPDKKYIFTPDQFEKKYSKSPLGDSYSVWLPWDEVGGLQKQITLVVRFTADKEDGGNGEMITSDEAHQLLPGTKPEENQTASTEQNVLTIAGQQVNLQPVPFIPFGASGQVQSGVQQANYQQPVNALSSQPQTFSVMQASAGATQTVLHNTGDPTAPVDVSLAPADDRMKTTTINVPQVPHPRFTTPFAPGVTTGAAVPATGFNAGVQSQMVGPMNQMPMQNAVQMQPGMQIPMSNQGQIMMMPGQMPQQNPNVQNQNGFTAPAMSGAANSTASNGQPVAAAVAPQTANATRSVFDKPRVLGAPIARLDSDRAPWPQSHAEPPSSLPSVPQSYPGQ
jgi:hypothetical protein